MHFVFQFKVMGFHIFIIKIYLCIYINKPAFSAKYQKINWRSFSQKYVGEKKSGNISLCSLKKTDIHRPEKIYIFGVYYTL